MVFNQYKIEYKNMFQNNNYDVIHSDIIILQIGIDSLINVDLAYFLHHISNVLKEYT